MRISNGSGSPLIINLAPTGMVATSEMSGHVPLQPDEIVRNVLKAAEIGVTMVHLHARDVDGRPTYKREVYARIISGIREHAPEMIIGVSCSGRDFKEFEQRSDVLKLSGDDRPDMASLTLSSLNFARQASTNEPEMVRALLERMLENGIAPEFEIFDLGMANYTNYLIDKLKMKGPFYGNVLLGNIATAQADLLSIAAITSQLPAEMIWGLGGIGNAQSGVTALAAVVAPAVRVGLEDNLWMDAARDVPATNERMVERIHQLAALADRRIMSSAELRSVLHFGSAKPA